MQTRGSAMGRGSMCVLVVLAGAAMMVAGCGDKGDAAAKSGKPQSKKSATAPSWSKTTTPTSPKASTAKGSGLTVTDAPRVVFKGFAAEGQGHPTEFKVNRPAVIELGGQRHTLPCTLWFTDETAPAGESPVTFRMRPGGSGYYDFYFAGGNAVCPVTTPEGKPLAALDVKLSADTVSGDRTKTILNLKLVEP